MLAFAPFVVRRSARKARAFCLALCLLAGTGNCGSAPEIPFDAARGVPLDEGRATDAPIELQSSASDDAVSGHRFVFASCNEVLGHPPEAAEIWQSMLALNPDVFVWTGDIVYPDRGRIEASDASMRRHYTALKTSEPYQKILERSLVLGVYDDHDYGRNNAGREFSGKDDARRSLLHFLDEPRDSPRRTRSGVYAGYRFRLPAPDSRGAKPATFAAGAGLLVQLLLLDTRFNREEPGKTADPLGGDQWAWLEEQLQRPADARIIVSSIQVLPTEHRYEKWANFPEARERLLQLAEASRRVGTAGHKTSAVVFVSGDRHLGEISRDARRGLVELTASGLTHSVPENWEEQNALRIGRLAAEKNFGLIEIDPKTNRLTLQVRGAAGGIVQELFISTEN